MIYGILLESWQYGICEVYRNTIPSTIVLELSFALGSFSTLGRYDELLIEKTTECNIIYNIRSLIYL